MSKKRSQRKHTEAATLQPQPAAERVLRLVRVYLLYLVGPLVLCGAGYAAYSWWQKRSAPQYDPPLVTEAPGETPRDMVWIPGGTFTMGNRRGAPDKNPEHLDVIPEHRDAMLEHKVALDGFWMDTTEVTNRQFKAFVEVTGYVTTAEKNIDPGTLPGPVTKTELLNKEGKIKACSICFNPEFDPKKVDKRAPGWVYRSGIWGPVVGANWRQPEGPGSSIEDRMDHPVVHVSYEDAIAYCKWAGKQLPTEAQWEYAARGGLERKNYPWGNELTPGGQWMANIWQGEFPYENKEEDGFRFAAPVASFPANGYGLHDMAGNVWEWCADWYRPDYYKDSPHRNPQGPDSGFDPNEPHIPKRIQRGGSFMCSDNYCIGYSTAARMRGDPETGSFHCGFRCVVNAGKLEEYRNAPARQWERQQTADTRNDTRNKGATE